MRKMKVVIVGSLSSSEWIKDARDHFANLGENTEVITPLESQEGHLRNIQRQYYRYIRRADLLVAVPKYCEDYEFPGAQRESMEFGESTLYEIAMAMEMSIPVVYWKPYSYTIGDKEEDDQNG